MGPAKIKISNSNLSIGEERVFIIAEIGKNFIQTEEDRPIEEYLKNAKELARLAKESGADAVKFQTHNFEDEQLPINVVSPHFKGADRYSWVKRNTESTPIEFWQELKKYCDEIGILFFSAPMSRGAAKKLSQIGVDLWKIGSADILDFVMLDYMVSTAKPIIISSGMSTPEELDKAIKFLKQRKAVFCLMHCISRYPCPPHEQQINTIRLLAAKYGVPVGFSSHATDVSSSLVAIAHGAQLIEKHFSTNRNLWGSDHKVSLMPKELNELCDSTRILEKNEKLKDNILSVYYKNILETQTRNLSEEESGFRPYFRKSLMAGKNILAGEKITADMLYAMRPQAFAGGLPSEEYENIIGKTAKKNLKKYAPITWDAIA